MNAHSIGNEFKEMGLVDKLKLGFISCKEYEVYNKIKADLKEKNFSLEYVAITCFIYLIQRRKLK